MSMTYTLDDELGPLGLCGKGNGGSVKGDARCGRPQRTLLSDLLLLDGLSELLSKSHVGLYVKTSGSD